MGGSWSASRPCFKTASSEAMKLLGEVLEDVLDFKAFLTGLGRLHGKVSDVSTCMTNSMLNTPPTNKE